MCGIVGAVSSQNIVPLLVDGLQRLEYRGYDSAGVAVINHNLIERKVSVGRVKDLRQRVEQSQLSGITGIAHTRWATHGGVTEANAHPHISKNNIAIVHNGIIENHEAVRQRLINAGYHFNSQTDTEVIVNLIDLHVSQGQDLCDAVKSALTELEGAYALGVIRADEPHRLIGARNRSPLIVGIGEDGTYIGSDISAIISATNQFIVLEDGGVVDITQNGYIIYDKNNKIVHPEIKTSSFSAAAIELGDYNHYMQKEIFEQGRAISDTLEGRLSSNHVMEQIFGANANEIFAHTDEVLILACGTSYYSGLVARHWLEQLGIRCTVEIATEYTSRKPFVKADNTLVVTISQSGETIDTLNALHYAKQMGYQHTLTICNAPESTIVRESDLVFLTHAGPEIGVASTKAFTTQLVSLMLLAIAIGKHKMLDQATETRLVEELRSLPQKIEKALELEPQIKKLAARFLNKNSTLFLGRGTHFPIALEGALKLKEISYIHAEAYPAGELKHGPLALIDSEIPVIAVAPNNHLLSKLKSNIQEVRARGGQLIVFADNNADISNEDGIEVIPVAPVDDFISPIIHTIPLQLLAYHVALLKGTDIDKPRNLAKSVTVE